MNKYITTLSLISVLSLSLGALAPTAQAQSGQQRPFTSFSNLLPLPLVKDPDFQNYYKKEWDNPGDPDGDDLTKFWYALKDTKNPLDKSANKEIIAKLFGQFSIEDHQTLSKSELYPVKFLVLRYIKENGPERLGFSSAKISAIVSLWQDQYLELAYAAISMSGVAEYKPILEQFKARLASGQIHLHDLSRKERESIQAQIPASHGANLLAKDENTGRYLVTGAYQATTGYFGIDFSKRVEETLVTFAHEVVHAADPQLDTYRATYKDKLKAALDVMARYFGGTDTAAMPDLRQLEMAFSNDDLKAIAQLISEQRAERKRELEAELKATNDKLNAIMKKAEEAPQTAIATATANDQADPKRPIAPPAPPDLTEADKGTIATWMRAGIGLTVENEYRAYGLSIVLYSSLRNRLALLPPDHKRQEFVERFIAGDDVFVLGLLVDQRPFSGVRLAVFEKPEDQLRASRLMAHLEIIYLDVTQKFVESLGGHFCALLKQHGFNPTDIDVLPDWAKPNGMDLPTNPYQILNARITSAAVVRFQQAIATLGESLRQSNTPLINLHANILDLSDVSVGEQKLVGIQFEHSPFQAAPKDIKKELLSETIDEHARMYFTLTQWHQEDSTIDGTTDEKTVIQNLLGLKLFKSAAWVDEHLPPLRLTTMGSQVFLQLLTERISIKKEEISEERVAELIAELKHNLELAEAAKDHALIHYIALDQLGMIYDLASNAGFVELAQHAQTKGRLLLQTMESLNIAGKETFESGREKIAAGIESLRKGMEKYQSLCQREKPREMVPYFNVGPFETNGDRFPLMLICYQRSIYAVRLPGDFTDYMTTTIENVAPPGSKEFIGAPHSRIFLGSRKIRLYPINFQTGGNLQ